MRQINPETIKGYTKHLVLVIFTIGVWVAFAMNKVGGDVLLAIYSNMIGYFFGERAALKRPNGNVGNGNNQKHNRIYIICICICRNIRQIIHLF